MVIDVVHGQEWGRQIRENQVVNTQAPTGVGHELRGWASQEWRCIQDRESPGTGHDGRLVKERWHATVIGSGDRVWHVAYGRVEARKVDTGREEEKMSRLVPGITG
jgi:hypothetical protein